MEYAQDLQADTVCTYVLNTDMVVVISNVKFTLTKLAANLYFKLQY